MSHLGRSADKRQLNMWLDRSDYERLERFAMRCGQKVTPCARSLILAILDDDEKAHAEGRRRDRHSTGEVRA